MFRSLFVVNLPGRYIATAAHTDYPGLRLYCITPQDWKPTPHQGRCFKQLALAGRLSRCDSMLHHSRHGASRFSRSLHETQAFTPEVLRSAARLTSIWRRDFASSAPHASLLPRTNANSTRWLQANGRRVVGARLWERPRVGPALISSVQWRTLSAGGKGGGDGKEEGLFDRLKKTFQEEIDKVCTPVYRMTIATYQSAEQYSVTSILQQ